MLPSKRILAVLAMFLRASASECDCLTSTPSKVWSRKVGRARCSVRPFLRPMYWLPLAGFSCNPKKLDLQRKWCFCQSLCEYSWWYTLYVNLDSFGRQTKHLKRPGIWGLYMKLDLWLRQHWHVFWLHARCDWLPWVFELWLDWCLIAENSGG